MAQSLRGGDNNNNNDNKIRAKQSRELEKTSRGKDCESTIYISDESQVYTVHTHALRSGS